MKKDSYSTACSKVFFMIGCQRSGSNWVRTMLSGREDLIAPHPPHIMREFMPILSKYGDLDLIANLKVLVDHVCAFVERNQVQWVDLHERPVHFNRQAIITSVIATIDCLRFNQRFKNQNQNQKEKSQIPNKHDKYGIDNPYYLLSIFDEIMNTMARVNGKKIWMCKSMGMSQFHEMLVTFYGKERLRYIYLVRDPRDVCLSFQKTPVGDCHPYDISKKWAKLQNHAAKILASDPDLVHTVHYEDALEDSDAEVAQIIEYMGARETCQSMRRGSVCAFKDEQEITETAKFNRESLLASTLSYQFQNLTKGKEFAKTQFKKWAREMSDNDLRLVESVVYDEMIRLGYEPHVVKSDADRIDFTDEIVKTYDRINKELIEKMYADLAVENPADLKRRQVQGSVLKANYDDVYNIFFMENYDIENMDRDQIYDAYELLKEQGNDVDNRDFMTDGYDFSSWPMNAAEVGYLTNEEANARFDIRTNEKVNVGKHLTITFAAASQGGYYPSNRTKANQDAYNSGIIKDLSRAEKNFGAFFSVFDGHGGKGTECSLDTSRHVREHVIASVEESIDNTMHKKKYDLSTSTHRRTLDISSHSHQGEKSTSLSRSMHSMYRPRHINLDSSFHRSMCIDFEEVIHESFEDGKLDTSKNTDKVVTNASMVSHCHDKNMKSPPASNCTSLRAFLRRSKDLFFSCFNRTKTTENSSNRSLSSIQGDSTRSLDSKLTQIKGEFKYILAHQIPFILADSFTHANQKILQDTRGIAEASGTTATTLFVTSNHFHIANVGDSRCLLITKKKKYNVSNNDSNIEVDQITTEHGTQLPSEVDRINAMGGVVMTSDQYDLGCATNKTASNEAKRVWSKDGKYPGTAFTRSIGDGNAKDLGVTAEPECVSIPITTHGKDTMFVLGTDGIFDFISNDEVGEVVMKYRDDLDKACRTLVGMAYSRWILNEERSDDITVIVGRMESSKNSVLRKLGKVY